MSTVASTSPEKMTRESSRVPERKPGWAGKVWVMGLRLLGIGSGVLAGMIAARSLSEADFGRLNVLLNQVSFWSIIASLGLNRLLVRLVAERLSHHDAPGAVAVMQRGDYLLWSSLLLVSALLIAALSFTGSQLVGFPLTPWQALFTGLLTALYGWHQVTGELLRGLHKIQLAGLFGAPPGGVGPLVGALSLVGVLLAAYFQVLSLDGFLAIHLVLAGVLFVPGARSLFLARREIVSTNISIAETIENDRPVPSLFTLAMPLVVMQALIFLGSQADVWIAGRELPAETVAHFSAAKRISVFITLPLQLAQLTTVAAIAQLYAQGETQKLQRLLQRAACLAFVPASMITLVALVAPAWLLGIMYGMKYTSAAPLLQILAVGAWLITATGLCSLTLIMTGHDRIAFPVTVVSALLLVVGGTVATRIYGATGLAICSSVVLGVSNAAQWWLARKYVGVWVHPAWSFSTRSLSPVNIQS
jgi:O-antigen/teichoic acid export membrane protein